MSERFPRWDDEPEDPEVYWRRKLQEARARDDAERQAELQDQINHGRRSPGRPFLVRKETPER